MHSNFITSKPNTHFTTRRFSVLNVQNYTWHHVMSIDSDTKNLTKLETITYYGGSTRNPGITFYTFATVMLKFSISNIR